MAEHDEDRAAQRAAILQRRARLVACAVMTGVITAPSACSQRCLSPTGPEPVAGAGAVGEEAGGSGGATTAAGGEGGGEPTFCLSVK